MEGLYVTIKLARIDDRLVHGQVATTWIRQFGIEQIIIISDIHAKDQVQSAVIQLAAPAGVRILMFEVEKFIDVYNSNPIKKATMLIYTNPFDVLKTIEGGVVIPYLNLGGMKFVPGKVQITKAVSLDENDRETFQKIIEKGVRIEVQMVPSDKKLLMEELLK
jgi:fructose PTS system EIIB component